MNTPPIEPVNPSPPAQENGLTVDSEPGAGGPDADLGFLQPSVRPDSLGRLGHYEILQVLGHGGFGIVLRAFDDTLHRVVAIKVLAPQMAATSPARKRFLREAQAAAQVRHENVVQIYAVEEQPLPFLAMEFIPGETLQARLDRRGPFDAAEVAALGRQMADGLAAAHAAGLIHRDVKPANVLIEDRPRPKVKLTDFGLARAADDASLTRSGAVLGTPLYMSPEQAGGHKLDHRSDLFSLGSVLYAITTGRPPFRAESTLGILRRVAEDSPRPIPEVIPEAPPWLCRMIDRLMAKDPNDRFQSAAEVSAALEAGAAGPSGTDRPARPRRRSPWLAAGAGAVVAAVALGIGLWAAGLLGNAKGPDPAPRAAAPNSPPEKTDPGGDKEALPADHRPAVGRFQFPPADGRPELPAVSEDGKHLAAPWGDRVWLFETPSGRRVRSLQGAGGKILDVAISSRGRLVAAVSGRPEPLRLRVWDLDTFAELHTQDGGGLPAFSPDGTLLVAAQSKPPRLQVWKARTGDVVRSIPGHEGYGSGFNPEGTLYALHEAYRGNEVQIVSVWNTNTWQMVRSLEVPRGSGSFLQFSPDGRLLAMITGRQLVLWDTRTFEPAGTHAIGSDWWFAFTRDGKSILTRADEIVRWDIWTGEKLGAFDIRNPDKSRLYPTLSADGQALYVSDFQGRCLRVCAVATGKELRPAPEEKTEKP